MARYVFQNTAVDGAGKILTSATVAVYLEDGTTAASIYTAESGGSAVNSVTTDSTNGSFSFFVDTGDYANTQKFKLTVSKTGYIDFTIDDIRIFPAADTEVDLTTVSGKFLSDLFDGGYDVALKASYLFGGASNTAGHTIPNSADDTFTLIGLAQTLTNKTLTSPVINTPTGDVVTKTGTQTLTNKTLTTPTIGSFTNATHDHTNAAGGGTIAGDFIVKGWVNFDGVTFSSPGRDNYNVTSLTDNGTGDYTITWATDFANVNYVVVGTVEKTGAIPLMVNLNSTAGQAVGTTKVLVESTADSGVDAGTVCILAIGDQ
jgi:hypothetical protein